MKNTPNILLMLVGKTQGHHLIYFTNISNIFQIISGTCKLYKAYSIWLPGELLSQRTPLPYIGIANMSDKCVPFITAQIK
jgi:hypothetical protein